MSVYKKLMDVRIAFNQLELKKSGHNKFAQYKYFELGDFLPQAQILFHEHGLCGVVSFGKELAVLRIIDIEDNSNIEISSPMAEANLKGCHPIQNLGAVETYTRRYLWVAALELVEHDAIDSGEPVKDINKDIKEKIPSLSYDDTITFFEKWEEAKIKYYGDEDAQAHAWHEFPSHVRSAIKKYGKEIKEQLDSEELDRLQLNNNN